MNALARQCIQVNRQGRHKGLALARAHFGNFAVMQGNGAQQLHVEMTHPENPLAALADHGKRLGQQIVQRSAIDVALRSEEHTSELQSLMRISYAVFCLKQKTNAKISITNKM